MDEVAQEAELSKGTLYLYFSSKFEIFAELASRVSQRILDGFESVGKSELSGRVMVFQMLEHWLEISNTDVKQFRALVGFIASDEHPSPSNEATCHDETITKIIRELSNAIIRGQKDGTILSELNPESTACQLWSGMMGAMLFHSRSKDLLEHKPFTIDTDNFMNNQIELLCRGLSAS